MKRILLTGHYQGHQSAARSPQGCAALGAQMQDGTLTGEALLARYCALLYERFGTYEEVARRADLDRRTVKKYVLMQSGGGG